MTEAFTHSAPREDTARGTLFALAVIPLGIVVWVAIWNLGWIAGIVAYGVAVGALLLYRLGSGGFVSRAGAVRVLLISVATIVLSLIAMVVSDAVNEVSAETGDSVIATFVDPDFWTIFQLNVFEPNVVSYYAPQVAIGLGIGLFGSFSTLRGAFRETAAPEAVDPIEPLFPPAAQASPADVTPATDTTSAAPQPPVAPKYGELAPPTPADKD